MFVFMYKVHCRCLCYTLKSESQPLESQRISPESGGPEGAKECRVPHVEHRGQSKELLLLYLKIISSILYKVACVDCVCVFVLWFDVILISSLIFFNLL